MIINRITERQFNYPDSNDKVSITYARNQTQTLRHLILINALWIAGYVLNIILLTTFVLTSGVINFYVLAAWFACYWADLMWKIKREKRAVTYLIKTEDGQRFENLKDYRVYKYGPLPTNKGEDESSKA
jgi:hypothetical protein